MKHIVFLLPGGAGHITGGLKVVYEYANRFAKDDYKVSIVYPASLFFIKSSLSLKIRMILRFVYNILTKHYSCKKWFKLNKNVQEKWVWSLNEFLVPKADYYVATEVRTSFYLDKYKIPNSKKIYFIQHFETWVDGINKDMVYSTYQFKMKKIVISNWLKNIVESINEDCCLVSNGFDFDFFKGYNDTINRDRFTIAMLYHKIPLKGVDDGLKALEYVKFKYPQLKVNLFGIYDKPENLPEWYTYYKQPDKVVHNNIYNESAIFLATSHSEGWGLTVGEAMICGCAVVCTEAKGYLEMAENEKNALVVPIKQPKALADAVIRLIENDGLRLRIAREGQISIKRFDWGKSYKSFKSIVEND